MCMKGIPYGVPFLIYLKEEGEEMKREFALILPNPTTEEHEGKTVTIFENPTDANMVAKAIYGETAYAVESTTWDIREPFIYRDGAFYNVEEKARSNLSGLRKSLLRESSHRQRKSKS